MNIRQVDNLQITIEIHCEKIIAFSFFCKLFKTQFFFCFFVFFWWKRCNYHRNKEEERWNRVFFFCNYQAIDSSQITVFGPIIHFGQTQLPQFFWCFVVLVVLVVLVFQHQLLLRVLGYALYNDYNRKVVTKPIIESNDLFVFFYFGLR